MQVLENLSEICLHCTSMPVSGQWRTGVGVNTSYCPPVTTRGTLLKVKDLHWCHTFFEPVRFYKKRVCEIDRYPQLPILHLDYGAKKLLFLVHKNNCIFIGEKLIEVKLRELNKHIIRCLKHHIGNLNNLTFFYKAGYPIFVSLPFSKIQDKKKEQHFRQRVWLQADELRNANDGYKINS